jgi:hypothetical protein
MGDYLKKSSNQFFQDFQKDKNDPKHISIHVGNNLEDGFVRVNKNKAQDKMPKHLTWKCLDDFDKVPDEKLFHVGKLTLSHMQRQNLSKIFKELSAKHLPGLEAFIDSIQQPRETHLEISGGNYTASIILPHIIGQAKKLHPNLPMKISLFEIGDGTMLYEKNPHIAMRGDLLGDDENNAIVLFKAQSAGYIVNRRTIHDAMFFAASTQMVEEFGGIKETLDLADLLVGREYVDYSSLLRTFHAYSAIPQERQNIEPRVEVDHYYMKYLLMIASAGIGHVHETMHINKNVIILNPEPFARYVRFCLMKKKVNKRYKNLMKSLMGILEIGK